MDGHLFRTTTAVDITHLLRPVCPDPAHKREVPISNILIHHSTRYVTITGPGDCPGCFQSPCAPRVWVFLPCSLALSIYEYGQLFQHLWQVIGQVSAFSSGIAISDACIFTIYTKRLPVFFGLFVLYSSLFLEMFSVPAHVIGPYRICGPMA